jgi:uncharacterized protein (TIGR00290 family)
MMSKTEPQPIVLSWSGGKDCLLMLRRLQADPRYKIVGLLTTMWTGDRCVAMHRIPIALLWQQAQALGFDPVLMEVPPFAPNAVYEAAFLRAVDRFRSQGVTAIAFGDLFLSDIRTYREGLCERFGMTPVFPLWGLSTTELASEFFAEGYRARICCTDSRLGREAVGTAYNAEFVSQLPTDIDPCGENGEFHTFVTDGPEFIVPVQAHMTGFTEADGFYWAQWAGTEREITVENIGRPQARQVVFHGEESA